MWLREDAMDAFQEELMLRLARELAVSHGTFFAAALLADMGVPFQTSLEALTSHSPRLTHLSSKPFSGRYVVLKT
jgi:hypothetical protein